MRTGTQVSAHRTTATVIQPGRIHSCNVKKFNLKYIYDLKVQLLESNYKMLKISLMKHTYTSLFARHFELRVV